MRIEPPAGVIDLHHHAGNIETIAGSAGSQERDVRLQFMTEHSIAQALILPQSTGITADTASVINDATRDYAAAHPSSFPAWLATMDPTDVARAADEVRRVAADPSCRGFVFHHHFQGTVIDDPRMRPLLEEVRPTGLPVFVHVVAGSLIEDHWRLEVLATEFRNVQFVALDAFSSPGQAPSIKHLATRNPNIVFDTGLLASVNHTLVAFLEAVGPERLLYGSDYYSSPRMFAVPFPLYELMNLGLPEEHLELILRDNARRLLGLHA